MINIAICDGSRYYADELKNYVYKYKNINIYVIRYPEKFSLAADKIVENNKYHQKQIKEEQYKVLVH